ncbi:MAG: alpha/beta fold hydrolase [Parvularculaceae bacterium]
MKLTTRGGVEIDYEWDGPQEGPVILLVMGLAQQLIFWPEDFVAALNDAGYRTLRFDNRDVGRSQKFSGRQAPNPMVQLATRLAGIKGLAPYSLEDMAKDTIGLLDGLKIDRADIVGISMGGMIGQVLAATYPDRVKNLALIMTSTNNPKLPRAKAEIARALTAPPMKSPTKEQALERAMYLWSLIGTKNSGASEEELRARLAASYERSHYPAGARRQLAAIIETGDLRKKFTRKITAPTLVMHGSEDPLAPPAGGVDVFRNIKDARLEIIEGMGHDIPKKFRARIAEKTIQHFQGGPSA